MNPIVLFLFVAINFNAADSVSGGHVVQTKTAKACAALQASYEAAMHAVNDASPPAFKNRWASACVPLVAANKKGPV